MTAKGSMNEPEKEPANTVESRSSQLPLWAQILLVLLVVFFGAGNLVARQIAAKTLDRFDYMLGLASAASYIVVYWAILAWLHFSGLIKDVGGMMHWVWCARSKPIKWLC